MKKLNLLIFLLVFVIQATTSSRLFAQISCPAPTGLSVTTNTQNSVTITWAASNTVSFYNVQYQTPTNPNWVILNNVSSPLTITGLNCGGVYVFQVQRVCPQTATSNPLVSDWAYFTFTTLPCINPCVAPTALTATNMSQNGAVLNWTGTSSATSLYNIRYRIGNTATWTTLSNVTMPYQLGNLPCGTGIEWQVQQVCTTTPGTTLSGLSPWSSSSTFSTLACPNSCVTPTGAITTNINQTSAVLNWNPNIIATPSIYNIRYHTSNSTTWIVVTNVSNPYQLTNLPCGTGYVWQVQQVCSSLTEPSPWSTGTTFSTLSCPIVCEAPSGLTATSINQTSAVLNWNPNSTATSLYNLQYHSATSNTWIPISNVTMPFTLGNLTCGTGYAWQVQRVCSSNPAGTSLVLSPWTTSTFSTSACSVVCEAPSGLTTTTINQTSAVLNWNPNAPATSLYNLQYHSATSNIWIPINNVTMPYQLGNLTCGTGYAWRVQRVCSNASGTTPTLSEWTTLTFSTSPCTTVCETPLGIVATNVTQTGAILNCTPNAPNSLYNIQYHGPNSTWITLNNVTLPYQLGNLGCGLIYEWRVQRVCSNAAGTVPSVSPWTVVGVFTTAPCQILCEAPNGLTTTNITQTSAVLNWNPNAPATSLYNLQYHSATSTTWITVNNVTMPYQLGNLTCGTGYAWRVQRVCNSTISTTPIVSPWTTITFSTAPCTTVCEAPLGIAATNVTQTGAVLNCTPNAPNSLFNIQYHGPNSTNWITVTNVTLPYQLGNLGCGLIYEWRVQRVCSNAVGTSSVSPWTVVGVFTTAPCQILCEAPSGLTTTTINQTSAVLNWNPNAPTTGVYNLQYHSATSTTWITVNNVTMPYQLGNLTCGTGYAWRVQRVCNSTISTTPIFSPWTTITFSTAPCTTVCEAPLGIATTNVTQTGAILNCTPNTPNSLYNIQYHGPNSTWITLNNVTLPYQLGNLSCGLVYEWRVQKNCGPVAGTFSGLSQWSVVAAFSTLTCTNPNPCVAPAGLSTSNINQNSAVLHWGPVTTPTSNLFNIRYRSANSTAWIVVNNVSSPFQLGNLSCSSGYVWQVQRICGTASGTNTELSLWSTPITFSTSPCMIPCPAPTELNATDISQTSAVLHWGVVPGAIAYIVSYKPLNNTSAFITVTTNTNSITINGLSSNTTYTYQVKAICANGTIATNISPVSLPYQFSTPAALVIYPNPANEILRMSYLFDQSSSIVIQLRDSYGQLVSSVNETAVIGLNEFQINTIGISEGLYFLTIKTNTDSITSKVFIKH